MKPSLRILLLSSLLVPTAHLAAVLIDGIQIYDDSANRPTKDGSELRVDTTLKGRTAPNDPRELAPRHVIQLTPESSYRVGKDLEFGHHLPSDYARPDSGTEAKNSKTNLKQTEKTTLDPEYYVSFGKNGRPDPFQRQSLSRYASSDFDRYPLVLNFGFGRDGAPSEKRWTAK